MTKGYFFEIPKKSYPRNGLGVKFQLGRAHFQYSQDVIKKYLGKQNLFKNNYKHFELVEGDVAERSDDVLFETMDQLTSYCSF